MMVTIDQDRRTRLKEKYRPGPAVQNCVIKQEIHRMKVVMTKSWLSKQFC